jgi:PleD family two-component response regulator
MPKDRILIVEDDRDISSLLSFYFESQGYDVLATPRGTDALEISRRKLPNLVILDIKLPDIDGYEVCRRLRTNLRTSHIPIIFLTQKDERADRIAGLQLGADDYVTKPFDMEELHLRVKNALRRASYENLTNPVTGLPSGRLIEEQLKALIQRNNWTVLYIGICGLRAFNDLYGFIAADDVLRFAAMVLGESMDALEGEQDFVGHIGGGDFLIITTPDREKALHERITKRFNNEVKSFYNFKDRERGHLLVKDDTGREKRVALMSMAVGTVHGEPGRFSDIREITEVASDARRAAAIASCGETG